MSRAMKGLKSAECYPLLLSPAQQIEPGGTVNVQVDPPRRSLRRANAMPEIREKDGRMNQSISNYLALAVDRLAELSSLRQPGDGDIRA